MITAYSPAMKYERLPPDKQRIISITMESLGRQGEGMAMLDSQRIYVPGALPGETVTAILREQVDRDVFRASLDAVTTHSAEREIPPCRHYEHCGGCSLQHMKMDAYQTWKTSSVYTVLEQAGIKAGNIDDPVFIPHATRRRAGFAVSRRGYTISAGFHGKRSHDITDIDACLLVHPKLLDILERSKPFLARLMKDRSEIGFFIQAIDGQAEIVLTGALAMQAGDMRFIETVSEWVHALDLCRVSMRRNERDEAETLLQPRPMAGHFGSMSINLPPMAFLQPSAEGEAVLANTVMDMLSGVKGKTFADLFAGCGTFTGRLLEKGSVHSYEFDREAVETLNNARQPRLKAEHRNLFTMPLQPRELKNFSAVVMDPPRAGAQAQAAELAKSGIGAVVYVSCNPSTFAKDVKIMQAGGYRLQRLRLVDQFVWSPHAEIVGLLRKQI